MLKGTVLFLLLLAGVIFPGGCGTPADKAPTAREEGEQLADAPRIEDVTEEEYRTSVLDYIGRNLHSTIETVGDSFPVATEKGVWKKDAGGWTGGYFAGMLWMMFEATGDSAWLDPARKYTRLMERYQTDVDNIDVGILFYPSFVFGYRATGKDYFRRVGLAGARTMMRRYLPAGGYFQNWGRLGDPGQMGFVIIDCLINLDHIYWAFGETGDSSFYRAATSHALRTMGAHVRQDASSYQVVEFDPATGEMLRGLHKQGFSTESTWSRGQSWGIYGFTRAYGHTGEPAFLKTACRMADWFLDHLPADLVPYWDFQAPGIPDDARDSSAGSMAASGLIELAGYVDSPALRERYMKATRDILSSLTRNYLTRDLAGRNDGVLTGSTYFYAKGNSVDQANIWGDYYYLETILRLLGKE
ncbi:MAG: glycoside hydrolase family 88 protein [Gemmatimonadota bacterium]|nr:glycoside hydrolase family 88 protein [Gemmatimonadota bacterium]